MAAVTSATCVGTVQVCAERFAALTSTGAPLTGLHGYQTNILTEATITPEVEEGEEDKVKNACGNICQVFEECDRLAGVTIEINVCSFEPDLINLLIGGRTFTSGGITQGFELPGPTDGCQNGTSYEAWQLAWDNDTQKTNGASLLYVHWIFPRVLWQISDFKQEAKFTIYKFTGKAKVNPKITANGPFDDWPTTSGIVAAGGMTGLGGAIFNDATIPVATCGLVNVPSSAS